MPWPIFYDRGESRTQFALDGEVLEVHTSQQWQRPAWRLRVGEEWSPWEQQYETILVWKGWGLVTAYWDGVLPELTPFKITPAKKVKRDVVDDSRDFLLVSPPSRPGTNETRGQAQQGAQAPLEEQEWSEFLNSSAERP